MVRKTIPWIQGEEGMTLILAKDELFAGPFQGLQDLITQNELRVVTTTQKFPLGSMIYDVGNDAVYRYVEYGGTIAVGSLVQAEGPTAAHDVLNPAGTGTGAGVAKGSTIISIATSITLVVNEYANGYLSTLLDTGRGYLYPIKSNEAGATTDLLVVLYPPGLAAAVDSTTDVSLLKSRWKEVIIHPTAPTAQVVGVNLGVGADGSFGWVCSRGPAAVVMSAALPTVGDDCMASNGTAGSIELNGDTYLMPMVGRCILPAANAAEAGVMFVTIE